MKRILLFLPCILYAGIWTEPEPLVVQLRDGVIDTAVTAIMPVTDPIWHRFWCAVDVDTGGRWPMGCIAVYNEEKNIWEEVVRGWPYVGGPLPDRDGNLWFIFCDDWTHQTEAARYNFIEDKKYYPEVIGWGHLGRFTADSAGNVWVFMHPCEFECIFYYYYNGNEWKGPFYLTQFVEYYSQWVSSAITDRDGNVWVAVVYYYTYGEISTYTMHGKLIKGEPVWSDTVWIANAEIGLCADREGNVWAVYCLRDGDSIEIDVRRFNGEEWEEPQVVWKIDEEGIEIPNFGLYADGNNRLTMVWIKKEIEENDTSYITIYKYWEDGKWSEVDSISGYSGYRGGIDPKGRVWLVLGKRGEDKIYLSHTEETTGIIRERNEKNTIQILKNGNIYIPINKTSTVIIYDAVGKRVRTFKTHNCSFIIWDKKDETGKLLPSGVYFIKIQGKGFERTEKVVILR